MNPIDEQLNRLFRGAAQGRVEAIRSMPFGLETRVLAAWRESRALPLGFWDNTVLARGLILASAIMAISIWPALSSSTTTANPVNDFLQLTDSTVPSDSTP